LSSNFYISDVAEFLTFWLLLYLSFNLSDPFIAGLSGKALFRTLSGGDTMEPGLGA
jgi:hypothetical protein